MVTTETGIDERLAELQPPAGCREASVDDAKVLSELWAANELRFAGVVMHTIDDVENDLRRPSSRTWLHEAADGSADLWFGVFAGPGHEHLFLGLEVAPEADEALGRAALAFLIEAAVHVDPTRKGQCGAPENDAVVTRWIADAGGVQARKFGRMEISLEGNPTEPPTPPAGITLRHPEDTDEDWHVLYDVIETAFRDHYGHAEQDYEQFVSEDRPWINDYSLCWLASVDGAPAAALLGKQHPSDGYVGVLGTLKEFRSRGLGKLLLRTAFAEFTKRGETLSALNVDLTNPTGAVAVYESVGMSLTQVYVAYNFDKES